MCQKGCCWGQLVWGFYVFPITEADRWLDMGRSCAIQQRAPCQSGTPLWDVTPDHNSHCAKEPGSTTAITSLIRDLSLCNSTHAVSATAHYTTTATSQTPTAPPSKRQCRSLSLSEEFTGFRSSWRPQGSRVWTTVEKRRCHSGGSVRGGGSHFPTMQRSSSFSLPSHSSITFDGIQDLPFFNQPLPLHPQFTASPVSPTSLATHHHHSQNHVFLRPLSLSHEQISLPEHQREEASETSSSDSTPELGRRASQRARGKGCLSRSRSQPCVLNEKKVGMKRRRPEDAQEQRPSLDLTKMTQVSWKCWIYVDLHRQALTYSLIWMHSIGIWLISEFNITCVCWLHTNEYQLISNLALMLGNALCCIHFNPEPDALTTQTNAFLFLD